MNSEYLSRVLCNYDESRIVFLGLGNIYREDDGAGIHLLRQLRSSGNFRESVFIEGGRNPENHISKIIGTHPEAVVFIDAGRWGGKPGDIKLLGESEMGGLSISTHSYDLGMFREYLLQFGKFDFYLLAIEPLQMGNGMKISEQVAKGLTGFLKSK